MPQSNSSFSRLEELLPELFKTQKVQGKSYLRGKLTTSQTVLLPMNYVQESLLISEDDITSIPNMPDYFVGLMTSRDEVLSLIDLPKLIGLNDKIINRRIYHTVITKVPSTRENQIEITIGFIFDQIQGVTRITSEQREEINPEEGLNNSPFFDGYLLDKEQPLPVLNIIKTVEKMISP
jgi:positive phototaxis protein PixI